MHYVTEQTAQILHVCSSVRCSLIACLYVSQAACAAPRLQQQHTGQSSLPTKTARFALDWYDAVALWSDRGLSIREVSDQMTGSALC